MRARRLHVFITGAAIALPCLATAAPPAPPGSGTTLHTAVENAWLRSIPGRTLDARQEEVEAGLATAQSWIAGSPALGLSQRSDRWTEQRGQRESEISLAAPIWLPGQKAARQALAARSAEELSAQTLRSRLDIAGEVRSRMWDAAAAQETLSEKRDHLHHLEELAEEVQRRVRAGDLARSDGLLAQQEVLAALIDVSHATTKASQALSRYRVLTGHRQLPLLEPEPLPAIAEPVNPRLAAARASELRAQAALRLAQATRSAPPSVGLSVRHEKVASLPGSDRSIGVAVQIPFGSKARNRPVEALAQTQIATAAAEAAQAQATVEADAELAQEQLANAKAALEAATARAAALREHTLLINKAFREGERGLAELLRSRALAHEADVAVRQQRVALGLAHAQINQVQGILP